MLYGRFPTTVTGGKSNIFYNFVKIYLQKISINHSVVFTAAEHLARYRH